MSPASSLSRRGPGSTNSSFNSISTTFSVSASGAGVGWGDSVEGDGPVTLEGIVDTRAPFPWKCGELLGRGRSGHVFKAMRSDTGELIAMKVCPPFFSNA